jgi:hypothetical protein
MEAGPTRDYVVDATIRRMRFVVHVGVPSVGVRGLARRASVVTRPAIRVPAAVAKHGAAQHTLEK